MLYVLAIFFIVSGVYGLSGDRPGGQLKSSYTVNAVGLVIAGAVTLIVALVRTLSS